MSYIYLDGYLGPVTIENIFTRDFCLYAWDSYGRDKKYLDRFHVLVNLVARRANHIGHWSTVSYDQTAPAGVTPAPGLLYRDVGQDMVLRVGDRSAEMCEIVKNNELFARAIEYWSAIPTYEEIRAYIPLPAELVDKIFGYVTEIYKSEYDS